MKEVWLKIKEFFDREDEVKKQNTDQELIDLAEDYKVMMTMPSWKHFESNLKSMFDLASNRLDNTAIKRDEKIDYFELKMTQERKQTLQEVMYIAFIAIGQGHHKEKERKQKGGENADTGK